MRIELCTPLRDPRALALALGGELCFSGASFGPVLGIATDSREVERGDLFVALQGKRVSGCAFLSEALARGATGLLVPCDIAVPAGEYYCISVKDPAAALLRAAAVRRAATGAFVVGVCGSYGKTTVKEALAAMLATGGSVEYSRGNFNSTVGMPLSLLSMEEADYFVLELGINRVGEMAQMAKALCPDLALLLNVGSAHIGNFCDFAELVREKASVASALAPGGILLLPQGLSAFPLPCRKEQVRYCGDRAQAYYRVENIHINKYGVRADIHTPKRVITNLTWPIPGKMGADILTFCAAVGDIVGLSEQQIREGLLAAKPPRMRTLEAGGRLLIDDAYNASPETVALALETLTFLSDGRPCVAVLGDMLELGELSPILHRAVGRAVASKGIECLFTYGEAARQIALGAREGGLPKERILSFGVGEERALALAVDRFAPDAAAVLFKASGRMSLGAVISMMKGV